MTHPFIAIGLRYRRAQAVVLREADLWASSGATDGTALLKAVQEMREAQSEYIVAKHKVTSDSQKE